MYNIAHRCNVLADLVKACHAGADFVEVDVHMTREGKLVCEHDTRFPTFPDLPTLAAALDILQGHNAVYRRDVGIIVDMKVPNYYGRQGLDMVDAVVTELANFGYTDEDDKAYVAAFDEAALYRARAANQKLKLIRNIGVAGTAEGSCAGTASVHCDAILAGTYHGPSKDLFVYGEPPENLGDLAGYLGFLISVGADGVFTKDPGEVDRILRGA